MIIYKLLLRLYPHIWRARYEEEVLVVLASRPLSFIEGLDILRGALDARLHPSLGTADASVSDKKTLLLSALRCSLLTMFCSYAGFILAGMGFQKLTESSTFQEAIQTHTIMDLSFHLITIGAIVTLLATLIGGLPIIAAVIKSSCTQKRWGSLVLITVPIIAFTIFLAITLFLETIGYPGGQSFWQGFSKGLFFGTLIAAAIVSTGALCFAIARSDIPEYLLFFALLPALVTTSTMALIAVSTIIWGLSLQSSTPHLFFSNEGIVGTSTMGTWLSVVIAMAITTSLNLLFLIRGISARSALKNVTS